MKRTTVKQPPLERYFKLLESIAGSSISRLSDIAEACELPVSSTHRAMKTLIDSGLAIPPGKGRKGYELGPRLLRLVHSGSDDAWIKIVAQKSLDELAERLGETCYMTKLIGTKIVSVASATPSGGLNAYVVPGLSQPLHAAASAKAILAFQPLSFVKGLLVEPLPKLCAQTKTTVKEVFDDLAEVRERGFATCVNENEAGIAAVACPVYLTGSEVIHAIGVTAVAERFPMARLEEYAKILITTAAALSRTNKETPESAKAAE
jgi:DNA-binding IclR family transcriptional regulator